MPDVSDQNQAQAAAAAEASAARKAARKAQRKADRKAEEEEAAPAPKKAKKASSDAEGDPEAEAAFLKAHEIVIVGAGAPARLCLSLKAAPFPEALVEMLRKQPGFKTPSPVQASTWHIAAAGQDVLAIAKTGSGKTLGFLLPVLTRSHREKKAAKGSPLALIMAPTRELALQIAAEALKFGVSVGCRSVAVYGGAAKDTQVRALQRGCELIIGTPGRIGDVLDVPTLT
jgi:ATP-dependent RNA helicase DDX5/DBP2